MIKRLVLGAAASALLVLAAIAAGAAGSQHAGHEIGGAPAADGIIWRAAPADGVTW